MGKRFPHPHSSSSPNLFQYVTPRAAVLERGADIVIVGRGIREAEDPEAAAIKYKEEAFSAYLERIEAQ